MTNVLFRVISLASTVSVLAGLAIAFTMARGEAQAQPKALRISAESSEKGNNHLYSQFMRGPKPTAQPPASNQKVYQAKIKRRAGGTPVIDVTFNGSKTFEMIVDTGASGTLITKRMATTLGVKTVGKVKAGIADGTIVEFDLGRVQSIAVGGAVVKNVEVAIAKEMEIGLLGHDFFGNYDVKIKKDVVEFYPR